MESNIEYKNLHFNLNQRNDNLMNQRSEDESDINQQFVNNKPKIPMSYYFPEGNDNRKQMNKNKMAESFHNEDVLNSMGMVILIFY